MSDTSFFGGNGVSTKISFEIYWPLAYALYPLEDFYATNLKLNGKKMRSNNLENANQTDILIRRHKISLKMHEISRKIAQYKESFCISTINKLPVDF